MVGGDPGQRVVWDVDVDNRPIRIDEYVVDAAYRKTTEPRPTGPVTVQTGLGIGQSAIEPTEGREP